ncbi:MAG: NOB1 family endonuclease [Promethearchaeota archaeon]
MSNIQEQQVIIVDTTIFLYSNISVSRKDVEVWITQEVLDELRSKIPRLRMEQYLKNEQVQIRGYSPEHYARAVTAAEETGDMPNLSRTDISVLALALGALEMGISPIVYSDDYSIQNVLKKLGIKFKSMTNDGIKKFIKWIYKCQACGATFKKPPSHDECPECGTPQMIKKVRA